MAVYNDYCKPDMYQYSEMYRSLRIFIITSLLYNIISRLVFLLHPYSNASLTFMKAIPHLRLLKSTTTSVFHVIFENHGHALLQTGLYRHQNLLQW